MAKNFFDVEKGFQIDSLRTFTSGTGDPTADEPVGSVYLEDDGTFWQKRTTGAGVANWRRMASEEFVNNLVDGRSWREPARVKDDSAFANLAAAETELNGANSFDGVSLTTDDRALFTNITGENKNVFIVNGTPGAGATFVEDVNLATDGDAIWIEEGTLNADTVWHFDGTNWVQFGAGDQTELAFIRTFIGKGAAGSETPNYPSNFFVTDGNDLESEIGALDTQLNDTQNDLDTAEAEILEARTETSQDNVTGVVTLDSVLVDTVASVKWFVYAQGNGAANAARKRAVEIHATHDGHIIGAGADAANTDSNVTSKLKLGADLTITYTVDLLGTGATQTMRLRVSAGTASDFRAIREIINLA